LSTKKAGKDNQNKVLEMKVVKILVLIFFIFSVTYSVSSAIKWESIGPDGGDMHFVYINSNHTVFASHCFGGFWRSVDGENWELIYDPEFVNMNVQAMDEIDGTLFAGGNKGLWKSCDDGKTWSKVITGNNYVDNGKYEVVSIIALSETHLFFTAKIDRRALFSGFRAYKNGFFELDNGSTTFWEIPESATPYVVTMLGYDEDLDGREVLFVSSSDSGLYVFDLASKNWTKILDKSTTRVFVDPGNDTIYVGTIGDWYYIGKHCEGKWKWEHVEIEGKSCAIAEFIVKDPYNSNRLWIGANGGERGSLYKTNLSGDSLVGVGFWIDGEWKELKLKENWGITIAIDRNRKDEDMENYTIVTPYGLGARIAYVPQAGRGCIQKTEDGGVSWRRAYSGIYGDTINKISYIDCGVRKGNIVVTCVSGNQITTDFGDTWEEGVDFTIGDIGFGLPGYSWGVASPSNKLEGRYDLLVATGYPPTSFTGNGVYAVDTECLESECKGKCMKRIASGPYFDLIVVGDKLFAGRMDEDLDIINLTDYSVHRIDVDGAGINVLYDGKKIFVSTESGGNRETDSYFFSDSRCTGNLYVCDDDGTDCRKIFSGERIISFSVNGSRIMALTNSHKLIYWEDYNSSPTAEINLSDAIYSGMVVDWGRDLIYISTFNVGDSGVYVTNFEKVFSGKLYPLADGLLERRVRSLLLANGYLFAGTEGMSVWRLKLPENFEPFANFSIKNVGCKVIFNASSSYDVDGVIVSYEWNFGDGTTASGVEVTHTYSSGGVYNVTLTVVDDRGLKNSISKEISVEPSACITGDVNGDGSVDVLDLTYLVNVILGDSAPTACSDVNGDGSIDVLDLTYLVNIILGT